MGAILNDDKQGANMSNSVHTTGPVECSNARMYHCMIVRLDESIVSYYLLV